MTIENNSNNSKKYSSQIKYHKNHYKLFGLRLPIEKVSEIQELATKKKVSMSALFISAFEKEYGIQLRKNSPNFKPDDQV